MRRAKLRAKRETDMVTDMFWNFVLDGSNEVEDDSKRDRQERADLG